MLACPVCGGDLLLADASEHEGGEITTLIGVVAGDLRRDRLDVVVRLVECHARFHSRDDLQVMAASVS